MTKRNETGRGRRINYDLCTAIDISRLSIVSEELIAHGANPARVRSLVALSREVLSLLRGVNDELEKE